MTISSDNDMAADYAVNVTVSSANDWKLKSSERNATMVKIRVRGSLEVNKYGTKNRFRQRDVK